jgi:rhodanese-related sulfurtransferase
MNISQEQWWEGSQNDTEAVLLDVRTADEWNDGIIPGAIHIDIYKGQAFIDEIESLDKSKNYYVYCRSGARSGNACNIMSQLGFANAFNLSGGIMGWNGPVVTPAEE